MTANLLGHRRDGYRRSEEVISASGRPVPTLLRSVLPVTWDRHARIDGDARVGEPPELLIGSAEEPLAGEVAVDPATGRPAGRAQALVLLLSSCLSVLGAVLLAPVLPAMQNAFADTPGVARR